MQMRARGRWFTAMSCNVVHAPLLRTAQHRHLPQGLNVSQQRVQGEAGKCAQSYIDRHPGTRNTGCWPRPWVDLRVDVLTRSAVGLTRLDCAADTAQHLNMTSEPKTPRGGAQAKKGSLLQSGSASTAGNAGPPSMLDLTFPPWTEAVAGDKDTTGACVHMLAVQAAAGPWASAGGTGQAWACVAWSAMRRARRPQPAPAPDHLPLHAGLFVDPVGLVLPEAARPFLDAWKRPDELVPDAPPPPMVSLKGGAQPAGEAEAAAAAAQATASPPAKGDKKGACCAATACA